MRALVLVLALVVSCKTYLPPVTHPVVDCLEESKIVDLVQSWWPAPGERPDWSRIQSEAIAKGLALGGCAFARYLDKYLAPPPGAAVPPPELAIEAKNAFEEYRSVHANNSTFKFRDGAR